MKEWAPTTKETEQERDERKCEKNKDKKILITVENSEGPDVMNL